MKINEIIKKYEFSFQNGYLESCYIPKRVAECPCCGSILQAEDVESYFDEDLQAWIPEFLKVDCTRADCYEEYQDSPMWRMPYVYWLPEEENAKSWVINVVKKYYSAKVEKINK